ncbi:NADPH-dependent FMN reductase [Methylotenera sp.]|uniref:NADPH-dependent FMN reductase n=1 Tax=Methylotenera sp. TaxID=2051956 RepID=UPI002486F3AD|nr:NADPH-dependent FMN reductase [Methylotenera sp.]MDI1360513.1 NAD(P)H-dependent oxidoreductase [Methylotenera sp.]
MKILAISGSLRSKSHNTALLQTAMRVAPVDITIEVYTDLGHLPLINPDLETILPPIVAILRSKLMESDAVLIATPEYAHGITGSLKNLLDWMVSCEAFVNKPVGLFNTSPRAVHAQASLREVISVMSALIVTEASVTLPILGSKLNEKEMIYDPTITTMLIKALSALQLFTIQQNLEIKI